MGNLWEIVFNQTFIFIESYSDFFQLSTFDISRYRIFNFHYNDLPKTYITMQTSLDLPEIQFQNLFQTLVAL